MATPKKLKPVKPGNMAYTLMYKFTGEDWPHHRVAGVYSCFEKALKRQEKMSGIDVYSNFHIQSHVVE